MSTQEPNVPYGTTGERLRAFASDDTRERVSAFAAKYWEIASYAALFVAAVILRFYNLGARAMHHDESLHGFFSYGHTQWLRGGLWFGDADPYKHEPFMHGPFQFIGSGTLMWIFGDGDYQARLLAAIMGTAMVIMPFFFRKQLGTFGALAAATFICFSPTLVYYSRFTREDIYTAFWTLGIVIFMWRYLDTKENKFLFLLAGFMAGSFCTKETSYMTIGAFTMFVNYMMAMHIADAMRAQDKNMSSLAYAVRVALVFPIAWAVAVFWPFIENWRAKYGLDESPPVATLLVIMGTLAVPMYAAAAQIPLGKEWQLRAGGDNFTRVADAERTFAYAVTVLLIGASLTLGLLWRPKLWAIAAACFWVPFVLLSTTFFANIDGFMSVLWGSMDYWISQQDVARGNQPEYYYFVTIPVYEFLTLALSVAAIAYYGIRGNMSRALFVGAGALAIVALLAIEPFGPQWLQDFINWKIAKASVLHVLIPFGIVILGIMLLPMEQLNRFLIFWVVVTSLALTVASEKMPWLNVHIAVAMCMLAGKLVGDILASSDLKADLPKLERIAPFFYAGAASALSIVVFVIVGPFELASFGAWALAIVAAVAVYWAFAGYSPKTAMQVAVVGAIAAFSVFSIRAAVLASWGHPDNPYVGGSEVAQRDYGEVPTELLVYTQTSGDIPILRDRLAEYARQTGRGYNQPVVVDSTDGFTWPWAWYLRKYKDVAYTEVKNDYVPKPGAVLFVSNAQGQLTSLAGQYEPGIPYHHRRWFPEEYRGENGVYTTHDFFGDLFSVDGLSYWLDFWVRRTLPAPEPGRVDGNAYFPIGAGLTPTEPAGPTVRTEGNQIIMGGTGSANGQLQGPSDVALDAQGNIYVADTGNGRIVKYNAQGEFQALAGGFTSQDVTFNQPWSLTVAPDGTVFVADTWNHRVVKLDSSLKRVKEWGAGGQTEPGGDAYKLFGPREITLTSSGNVMISDTGNSRVIEYTAEGDIVRQFGRKGTGGAADELSEPVSIVTNAAGDIYLADFWNKRIIVMDKDLALKRTIGVDAWGSQAVTDRAYLALLADGRLLATDPEHGKILVFSADGSDAGSYDVPLNTGATFSRPVGLTSDGTSVIVSDSGGNVVRKIPLVEVAP